MPEPRSSRLHRLRPSLLLAAVAAMWVPAPFATAQSQSRKLDDARFIQGLREKGLKDLLVFYLQKFPPQDPVIKLEILVEQQKLNFEDESLSGDKRAEATLAAVAAYRELFKAAPKTHWKLPLWKTDFAAYVIRVVLPARYTNAAEFVEFGVPTGEQRQAFDQLVAEIHQATEQAADEMFFMMGDLPRQPNFVTDFENTGLWDRIKTDYADLQVPYYRAWAIHYATLMSKPQGNGVEARDLLRRVPAQELNAAGAAELNNLLGRIQLALALKSGADPGGKAKSKGDPADAVGAAIDALKAVASSRDAGPLDRFTATLAVTRGLQASQRHKDAIDLLDEARKSELVQGSPMFMILCYDRQFQITGDTGVYARLFEESSIKSVRDQVQTYVARRLSSDPKKPEELKTEPPLVVLGHVDGMLERAASAEKTEDKTRALADAVTVLTDLLARADLPKDVRAKSLFKVGVAEFQRGQPQAAAAHWIKLADEHADMPEGENAANNAFLISRQLFTDNPKSAPVIQLFDQAQQALLAKYAASGNNKQHWYTRGGFLLGQKRYADAVEALKNVDPAHPFHADSIYEIAIARHGQWLEGPADKKTALAKAALPAVEEGIKALQGAASGASTERATSLTEKLGDAVMMKAELLAEGLAQPPQAAAVLKDFDQQFAQFPKLLALKRPLAVSILVAQGMIKEANAEIDKFRAERPDQAGPLIKSVLDKLSRIIEDHRAKNESQQAMELSAISVGLAQSLHDWAKTQKAYATPETLLPFDLILADQMLVAGQTDKAADYYDRLVKQPGGATNLNILYGKTKADLAAKRYEAALNTADQIASNLKDQTNPIYWHSWLLALQALDGLAGQAPSPAEASKISRSIFTSVAKLRNQNKDMGGESFKAGFEALSVKHQPK
jgi:hypothetical protein